MLTALVMHVVAGIAGLWAADAFVPNVAFTGDLKALAVAGGTLGAANAVLKPVLNLITLPLRILTLGLSGLLIALGLVWALDLFFAELVIEGIVALVLTTLLVWVLGVLLIGIKRT